MTQEMERYLSSVKLWMFRMPGKAKKGVLMELRSHIMESAAAMGGPAFEGAVISNMDSPRKTAKRYKEIYGYNMFFKILFVLITIFLAIWTVPIWELVNPSFSTSFIFLLLVIFLFYTGSRAGKRMALTLSLSAIITRVLIVGIIAAAAGEHGVIQGGGVFMFLISSLLLIPIAYFPARVVEKWEEKKYWPSPMTTPVETRPCPRCGLANPLSSKFCNECGSRVW
jgi:NADH:ubiquinone oxidoreductase subunit 3 (subunit A)